MERCPNCQEEIAPELNECKFCHAALYKPCPMCHERIRAQAVKCRFCKTDLNQPAGAPPSSVPGASSNLGQIKSLDGDANTALILGIIGLFVFHLLAPFAWYMGRKVNRKLAELGQPANSNASLGMIFGIIGTVIMTLVFLVVIVAIIIAIIAAAAGAASGR
jgi:uncharacterized membrane protein YjgN (DUF898 family)